MDGWRNWNYHFTIFNVSQNRTSECYTNHYMVHRGEQPRPKSLAYQKQTQLFSFKESFVQILLTLMFFQTRISHHKRQKAPLRQYIPSLRKLICFCHMAFLLIWDIYDHQLGNGSECKNKWAKIPRKSVNHLIWAIPGPHDWNRLRVIAPEHIFGHYTSSFRSTPDIPEYFFYAQWWQNLDFWVNYLLNRFSIT